MTASTGGVVPRYIALYDQNPDGTCMCSKGPACTSPGKHPRAYHWQREAVERPEDVIGSHVGFRTGDGIVVIDCDVDKATGAQVGLDTVRGILGCEPTTYRVRTRSGGVHLYYRIDPAGPAGALKNSVKRLPGVDVRAAGGYVVAPPTPGWAYEGGGWEWLPEGLLTALLEAQGRRGRPKGVVAATGKAPPKRGAVPARGSPAWAEAARLLASIWPPDGARNEARMYLVGGLAWWGFTEEEIVTFVADLYAVFGGTCDPLPMAERALARRAAGEELGGWGRLADELHAEEGTEAGVTLRRVRVLLGCVEDSLEVPEGFMAQAPGDGEPAGVGAGPAEGPSTAIIVHPGGEYKYHYGDPSIGACTAWSEDLVATAIARFGIWQGVFGFDERAAAVRCIRHPPTPLDAEKDVLSEADVTSIVACFGALHGAKVSRESVYRAVERAAQAHRFDPVVTYLDGLPAGVPGWIEAMCSIMGIPDGLERTMVRRFLVSAVARAYEPACPVRSMLVLIGPQQAGKSTWVRTMFGQWTQEGLPPVESKDAQEVLLGRWGVEVAEFAAWLRADPALTKDFLSRREDIFRRAYARNTTAYPRRCVFVGTTNDEDALPDDPTGATRYSPVHVQAHDVTIVAGLRDLVWAEARDLYRAWVAEDRRGGLPWDLTPEERPAADALREHLRPDTALEIALASYLEAKTEAPVVPKILSTLRAMDPDIPPGMRTERTIAGLLRKAGWRRVQRSDGHRVWCRM